MVSMVIGNYVSNVMVTAACSNMHAAIGTEQDVFGGGGSGRVSVIPKEWRNEIPICSLCTMPPNSLIGMVVVLVVGRARPSQLEVPTPSSVCIS